MYIEVCKVKLIICDTLIQLPHSPHKPDHTIIMCTVQQNLIQVPTQFLGKPTIIHLRYFIDTTFRLNQVRGDRIGRDFKGTKMLGCPGCDEGEWR